MRDITQIMLHAFQNITLLEKASPQSFNQHFEERKQNELFCSQRDVCVEQHVQDGHKIQYLQFLKTFFTCAASGLPKHTQLRITKWRGSSILLCSRPARPFVLTHACILNLKCTNKLYMRPFLHTHICFKFDINFSAIYCACTKSSSTELQVSIPVLRVLTLYSKIEIQVRIQRGAGGPDPPPWKITSYMGFNRE